MSESQLTLPQQLRQAMRGHPHAKIPWPHRLLSDAANLIEKLEVENKKRKTHIGAAMDRIDADDVIGAYTALLGSNDELEAESVDLLAQRDALAEALEEVLSLDTEHVEASYSEWRKRWIAANRKAHAALERVQGEQ